MIRRYDPSAMPPLPPLGQMPSAPRKILLVKPSSLGDVVTAMPALRGLRRTLPNARIAWFISTGCAAVIEKDTDLDDVVLFDRKKLGRCWRSRESAKALWQLFQDLKQTRYDWVIDLQGLFRSGLFAAATKSPVRAGFADCREFASLFYTRQLHASAPHTVDRNIWLLRQLGIDARREDFSLQVAPEAAARAESIRARHGLQPQGYLVCVPPTRWTSKRYPVHHWRKILAALRQDVPVVLLGSPAPEERELCAAVAAGMPAGVIDLSGQTTIPQMVAMIGAGAGVICCDSSAKFIAPAVGVDVVALLGPTQCDRTGPYLRGTAVLADIPCQGCLRRTCRHHSCMELIDPQEVIDAARGMLQRQRSGL